MYQEVLEFWFDEVDRSQWWSKDVEFDKIIIARFSIVHARAVRCELYEWRESARGRLAEIILLDQFSRNMFRDSPLAFAYDAMALVLAQEAVSVGADRELSSVERSFMYMPFMHSESLKIHEIAIDLFKENGIESSFLLEVKHKEVIEKYGRYPHRNSMLGRESTEEELEFLGKPGSGF